MDIQNNWIKKQAMHLLEALYQGEQRVVEESYNPNTEIWIPYAWGKECDYETLGCFCKIHNKVDRLRHLSCVIQAQTQSEYVISGNYYVIWKDKGQKEVYMHYTIFLEVSKDSSIIVKYLHISENYKEKKRYCVKDVRERLFFLSDDEILYLEALHNHVIWHGISCEVETVGSLKQTEKELSSDFIRIQRSYVVNVKHIRKIARCYAELDNGEMIPIPVKKYCNVKERIWKNEIYIGIRK
ncbi:MAG: LytTR family transcriptional regulator DNA-binding domain-containing protein [Lachnospiraceae bacterium]|nr:LytTR family transcriptional regulator DNA-binding domain-containing protein [Lachnospiraceae bacterium]